MQKKLVSLERFLPIFNDISKTFTPDFSGEDWLNLFIRASKGDTHSLEMLYILWTRKVNPYLLPEFQMECINDFFRECELLEKEIEIIEEEN